MKIICVLFFVLNIIGWIMAYPDLALVSFIDIPSLIIVFLPIYMAIAYRYGWKSLFDLKFHTDVWVKSGKEQDDLLKTIAYTALMTGALGSAIGLVMQFFNWNNPPAIGPAMAISLLTVIYALLTFLITVLIYFVGRENES